MQCQIMPLTPADDFLFLFVEFIKKPKGDTSALPIEVEQLNGERQRHVQRVKVAPKLLDFMICFAAAKIKSRKLTIYLASRQISWLCISVGIRRVYPPYVGTPQQRKK
jgi:hypothetical protein